MMNIWASFIEIAPLSTEISHHAKYVLTDGRNEWHSDGQPVNVIPSSPIVGECIKISTRYYYATGVVAAQHFCKSRMNGTYRVLVCKWFNFS